MRLLRLVPIVAFVTMALIGMALPVGGAWAAPDLLGQLDMDYVEEVTTHLTTIGSTEMGFRVMGTPQDQETANYLAEQMANIGLEGVAVEEFTGDGWLFEGGSVEVAGPGIDRTFKATSNGSVPGTGPEGVSGRLVFVGNGTAPEYAGLDLTGKIAFAWWDYDRLGIWPNYIAYEAKAHGAEAVIIASAPAHEWYSAGHGNALGSNDGECGPECAPLVIVSKRTGHKLVNRMASGRLDATVTLNAQNLLGSTAYQAIGEIPGSDPDKAIVFTAHHDAWFTSAADDSVAVAMMLAIAKAAMDSGYQPEYTWIFAPVTGEEYGLADAYYDWLQGAFHRITQSHPEWQTEAVAVLNWELHSPPYSQVGVSVPRELDAFVGDSLSASQADGLIGEFGLGEIYSWNDGFTYTAEGAPAVTFASSGFGYGSRYHTDYDSLDTLDFPGLKPVLEAEARVALDLDASLVPWDFSERINDLGNALNEAAMDAYGADTDGVMAAYERLQDAWALAEVKTPDACVAEHVREAVRISDDELTALSFWDDTIYPQDLAQWDLSQLGAAIAQLQAGQWRAALVSIENIDMNFLAPILGRAGFDEQQKHHSPGYAKISWGAQGQLTDPLDLYDVWHSIRATAGPAPGGDFSAEIAQLEAAREGLVPVYRSRVSALATTLNDIALHLEKAAACTT